MFARLRSWMLARRLRERVRTGQLDADFYQGLHERSQGYQENNWLVDEARLLDALAGKCVCELGSGNGRFLRKAATRAAHVIGLDWARSPVLGELPENAELRVCDLRSTELPSADVLCSGDVLEHFGEEDLVGIVGRLRGAAPLQYHVIACYDDRSRSHLTVQPPNWWKAFFERHAGGSYELEVRQRSGNLEVAVLHNL